MLEAEAVRVSMLQWIVSALGIPYIFLLPLAGLVSFVLALLVVLRGKGPMAVLAVILIVPIPFLVGLFAATNGAMASLAVIASSPTAPKPAEIAEGVSTAIIAPMVGMLLMVPAYAAAVVGAIIRSFRSQAVERKDHD